MAAEQRSGGVPAQKRHDPQFVASILKLIQVDKACPSPRCPGSRGFAPTRSIAG